MATFFALLRGVNVGGANRVPMADLRTLLSALGYTHITTLLNSGNAVFRATTGTAPKHAEGIASALARELKVEVSVVVKSAEDWAAIVADCPINVEPSDHSKLLVAFAPNATALSSLSAIEALVVPPERLALGRSAAYLYCATGIHESKAGAALLGKLGKLVTTRNWATVLKLAALADGAA